MAERWRGKREGKMEEKEEEKREGEEAWEGGKEGRNRKEASPAVVVKDTWPGFVGDSRGNVLG